MPFESINPYRAQHIPLSSIHPYMMYDHTIRKMEEDYVTRSNYDESNDDTVSCASSTSNLIDDNIDYNVVYALHIFIATVEGQVSVMRGDKLILLDDNNSYWWLVKIVKTSDIGYIPAENIETPFERLARFNKYRNTEVIFIPSSVNEYIHRRKSTNKKVTMATNVSIQSMIVTLDDDSSQITETFQESQGNIDHPFASTTIDPDTTSSSTRLSNHALSIGLAQHFVQHRTIQSSSSSMKGNSFRQLLLSRSKYSSQTNLSDVTPSSSSSSSPLISSDTPSSLTEKLSVLRVFAGNISAKATFYSVLVTENTTAEQLLNLALDRYHLADDQQKQCEGIEYYITAKVIDGDEIALAPQDKPLAIFHSLNTHLTTPMPSLTHIRSKIQLTRIGVSKTNVTDSFGENSVIRFLLHKRIKRINEQDGHLRIKIAYYNTVTKKSSTTTTFSPSRFSQFYRRPGLKRHSLSTCTSSVSLPGQICMDRIEKLVSIPGNTVVSELTCLALEKFHIQQGVPYNAVNEKMDKYGMTLVVQGKEHVLNGNRSIIDVLQDKWLNPKGTDDQILFVLRKMQSRVLSPITTNEKLDDEGFSIPTSIRSSPTPRASTDSSHLSPTNDICNSSLSSASTSSSESSLLHSSLTIPDSTNHGKVNTDILLHQIDLALLSLEKVVPSKSSPTCWFNTTPTPSYFAD